MGNAERDKHLFYRELVHVHDLSDDQLHAIGSKAPVIYVVV
jgi:hypothetical protein